nr:hypothetical protein [Tanacetum cinerariifolium]
MAIPPQPPVNQNLERELSHITQGNLTIASFFNKLKKCWDELQNLNGLPTCNCGKMKECTFSVIKKFVEMDNNSKLIQFLMKLSYGYESVRSQILAMDPLPSVNKAYYIVQQIEKQKQVTNHVFEPTTFFSNMNNKGGNLSKRDDWYKGKTAKKSSKLAAHVNSGFEEHFHGDTPFDLGTEYEVAYGQNGGVDRSMFSTPTFANEHFEDELFPLPNTPLPPNSTTPTPTTHNSSISNTPKPITHEPSYPDAPTQIPSTTVHTDNGPTQTRKSTRQSAKPSWLKDFVTPHRANAVSTVQYPLFSAFDFKGIPHSHIAFLANAFAAADPISFHQAKTDDGWIEAMNKELAALKAKKTWTLTSLPSDHTPITSK